MRNSSTLRMVSLLLMFIVSGVSAQQAPEDEVETGPVPEPKSFVTNHQIQNGNRKIAYQAEASERYLNNDKGEPVASIWSVSYRATETGNPAQRPVTFIFNGGPGSASVWLHMGLFGPQLVEVDSDATVDDGAAPYSLKENREGLLDVSDLVFIDPVGTGFSRVIGKGEVTDFWGLNEDAQSIAKFIREWITENNRWMSPKFIAGESFGTTRAVAVAQELEGSGQNMALNGLILISQALDYGGSTSSHYNITSYITYLPSMAATAWYHKKAGQGISLEEFVEQCREFTYNTYIPALYKGSLLTATEKEAVAREMARFTGLTTEYILQSDLRVLVPRFQKELLRDKGLTLGRLDGRFMGNEIDTFSDGPHLGDPASYQISGAYTAALNHYLRSTLQVEMDRPYLTSNSEIGSKWNWRPVPEGRYWEPERVNVAHKLGETMRRNPQMQVLVANGYYDLICPFFDAEYTYSRNGIETEKIQMTYYQAGHMMYTHQDDYLKLARDIRAFMKEVMSHSKID